ncbi:MAG TPA: hypothetical protein VF334_22825, partial [Polyangia bacterium]
APTTSTCQPGTSQPVCGPVGGACTSCVGNATGTACLGSGACGCNSAADCAANHACDLSNHLCTTSCNANQPCNGGCCSSAGSCAVGNSTGACGSTGGLCSTCATNTACASYSCNGSSCITTYAPSSTQCLPPDPANCLGGSNCTGISANCPSRMKTCTTCCKGDGTCTGLACP